MAKFLKIQKPVQKKYFTLKEMMNVTKKNRYLTLSILKSLHIKPVNPDKRFKKYCRKDYLKICEMFDNTETVS